MPGTLIYLSNCAISADGRQNPFMMQELPWLMAHFDRVMMVSYYGVRTLMPGDERGERPEEQPGYEVHFRADGSGRRVYSHA